MLLELYKRDTDLVAAVGIAGFLIRLPDHVTSNRLYAFVHLLQV
jgi:hypothetical protein